MTYELLTQPSRFDKAVDIVQGLPRDGQLQPSYEDKLILYGLFKQGQSCQSWSNASQY